MINNDLFNFSKMKDFLTIEFFNNVNYRIDENFASNINDYNIYMRKLFAIINIKIFKRLNNILINLNK